jgi:hypothetical protein
MNFMSFSRRALNSSSVQGRMVVYARAGGVLRPALYARSRGVLHPALLESLSSASATTSEE